MSTLIAAPVRACSSFWRIRVHSAQEPGSRRPRPLGRCLASLLLGANLTLCSFGGGAAVSPGAGGLTIVRLHCEDRSNPLGVDAAQPRLSWTLESTARDQKQGAFQILVAGDEAGLRADRGDLWDSGKVRSDETVHIHYGGRPLRSSQQAFWKVRVWDANGRASAWSATASWSMGLLGEDDWQGRWIGGDTNAQTILLRREFTVGAGLRRALIHVCGLGQYALTVNGRPASQDLLEPGWTKYDRTCLYETYDITDSLADGRAAIGLLLGNGMYNVRAGRYTKFTGSFGPLKAIAQIQLEYADGHAETIGTDERWRSRSGPVTFSCVYGGEDRDARLEQAGWDRPGFTDAGWTEARIVAGPGGRLRGLSCAAPPIRAFETLKPVSANVLRPGVTVYDLGQNAPIMPRLRAHGAPGSRVRIIPAELLHADGSVDRGSVGGGDAWWQYTLAGRPDETWFPSFFYHGCRYLQVELNGGESGGELPRLDSIEGVVVHSSAAPVGRFNCSNELFNRIHTLIRWAQRANLVSVITDCPHRERLGWLEQYHLNGPSLRYEFDLGTLFAKGMNDMADSQLANGLVPDIAPEYVKFDGGFRDSPEWGSAFVIVPWQQYEWTGDLDLLRRHYEGMKRYVDYLRSKSRDSIVSHGLGDWYDLGPNPPGQAQLTPTALTATAFYFRDTWIVAQTAARLGHPDEAREFGQRADAIRAAFNRAFFKPDTGGYATGSQCANALPLVMGLVEPANRGSVLEGIVRDVEQRGQALTAGDVGYRYLLRALADGGRSDVIQRMNNQSEKPGYGFQLAHGATSLTEAWDAGRGSSQNHFMLGHIMEWFYHDLAGIQSDGPGFKRILIRPAIIEVSSDAQAGVQWVSAEYDSIHGRIASQWRRAGDRVVLKVEIPANTTATVFLPAKSAASVREGNARVSRARGVRLLREQGGCAVLRVGSGVYDFESRL